jgi:anaphase-promoting complex subunit 4
VSLTGHVRVVLDRITTWQSKMLPSSMTFEGPDTIPTEARACDMRMIANRGGDLVVNVLLADKATLYLHTKHSSKGSHELSPENNNSNQPPGEEDELLDAKFLSEKHCILLRRTASEAEDGASNHYSLNIITLEPGLTTPPAFSSQEAVVHDFASEDAFRPERLLVGGRKDKRVCVVFGDGGKAWRVFDLSRRYIDAVVPKADNQSGMGFSGDESTIF